jgi:hypothetical protein
MQMLFLLFPLASTATIYHADAVPAPFSATISHVDAVPAHSSAIISATGPTSAPAPTHDKDIEDISSPAPSHDQDMDISSPAPTHDQDMEDIHPQGSSRATGGILRGHAAASYYSPADEVNTMFNTIGVMTSTIKIDCNSQGSSLYSRVGF